MKFKVLYLLMCMFVFSAHTTLKAAELPVEKIFASAQVKVMKLSPNGENIAFTFESDSEVRLAVMSLKTSKILSSFTFGENQHVVNFYWANDKRVLMEVAEVKGHLISFNGNARDLYAANIDGTKRDLLLKSGRSTYRIISLLPDDKNKILIEKWHWAEKNGARVFSFDINRGEEYFSNDQPKGKLASFLADNTGKLRLAVEVEEDEKLKENKVYIHLKNGDAWEKLSLPSQRENPDVSPVGFSADNTKAYFTSNFDVSPEDNDKAGLFSYNYENKKITLLARGEASDIVNQFFGADRELLAISYLTSPLEYDYITPDSPDALLLAGLKKSFPGEMVYFQSHSKDKKLSIFKVYSDRNPGTFFLYDKEKKSARFMAAALPELKKSDLVPMLPVALTARDGVPLKGWLTLPQGQNKNLPLIVNVHGGPFGVYDEWGFNPETQFFASHGYATLQVNYRGSGGFGEDFEKLGRLQWGKAMQDDVTDATKWAISQGIADPNRICIYGGSYGGYAALWGVIKEPDLYRCSVGYVGAYDMTIFFNGDGSDASRNDSITHYLESSIGVGEAYLKSISPVHNADKIKVPVFLAHGADDVRVTLVHGERMKAALEKNGKQFQWMVKPEGHGYYHMKNKVELYNKMIKFIDDNIGGK
ncbi:alpha/beta hydrolase family protein [Shewanella sp. YIC-542]|uniref:alpha/beta hydrolase family protein n=1 Tax=Shewanella mytili TaxID=3377111 RepID=UPI00398ECE13